MKRTLTPKISALILILAGVVLGGALVTSLGGPGGSGVWHQLYDVSRDAAGTLSVDPNQNGDIDFIENNIVTNPKLAVDAVTTDKINDGEVAYDDVNPSEVCAISAGGNITPACWGVLTDYGCTTVFQGNGGGVVPVPRQCYDDDADGSGSCEIIFTFIQDFPATNHYYGVVKYTQFDDPNAVGGGGPNLWLRQHATMASSQSVVILTEIDAKGTNGNTVATNIFDPQTMSGLAFRLVDDAQGQGETGNQQWYLIDNQPGYSAQIRVC